MTNQSEALAFLRQHQPFQAPLSEEALENLTDALAHLKKSQNPEVIAVLLGCFGDWDQLWIYDAIQSILQQFPTAQVVTHLSAGLNSLHESVRQWCADTARFFPDPSLIPYLSEMLNEQNAILRLTAAAALENIRMPEVKEIANCALSYEKDDEVRELLEDIAKIQVA